MKKLIFLMVLSINLSIIQGQSVLQQITDYSNFVVTQSTTVPGHEATLAIDNLMTADNYTKTYYGENDYREGGSEDGYPENCLNNTPWWQIDLMDCYLIKGLEIHSPIAFRNYYIFYSEFPFNCDDINILLSMRGINYLHVAEPLNASRPLELPSPKLARYIRIQGDNFDVPVTISEIRVFGNIIGCDVMTELEKYGEDCDDGIDNDGDGKTDCQDWPCAPDKIYTEKKDPTCPICMDGQICIVGSYPDMASIDGGEYFVLGPGGAKCFDNLGIGTHEIKIKSKFGCIKTYPFYLAPPPGNPTSHCLNGDFEKGDFSDWEGGLTNNSDGNLVFNNTDFDLNGNNPRHSIINTANFEDPYFPEINGNLNELGKYIAKLGNDFVGSEAERLVYYFSVDNINKNFYFSYALVQQDPIDNPNSVLYNPHSESMRPMFGWKIYKESNPSQIIIENYIHSNDDFLVSEPLEDHWHEGYTLKYKGWTCQNYDLSSYVGEDLVIEFQTADCTLGEHFGYAYIDGVCGVGFTPNPILVSNEAICENQYGHDDFFVSAEGAGFNSFFWDCKIINSQGIVTHQFSTNEKVGYSDKIKLAQFIYLNTHKPVECDSKIILGFNGLSNCVDQRVEKEIIYSCNSYNIEYCDPLRYCGGGNVNQIQIMGNVDCENCTYEWESSSFYGGLNHFDIKFPTVDREKYYNAFDNTYYVSVTSPEGCVYADEVNIKPAPSFQIFNSHLLPGICENGSGVSIVTVELTGIEFSFQELSFVDKITGQIYVLDFDPHLSKNGKYVYKKVFPRNISYDLELDLSDFDEFNNYPVCYDVLTENCAWNKDYYLEANPPSPFAEPWLINKTNVFTPADGDGVDDFFYLKNFNLIDPENPCEFSSWDGNRSSITYYRIRIWEGYQNTWQCGVSNGTLVYFAEATSKPYDENGIDLRDFKWDGHVLNDPNGLMACFGATKLVEVKIKTSCPFEIDYDVFCEFDEVLWETSNENEVTFTFTMNMFP